MSIQHTQAPPNRLRHQLLTRLQRVFLVMFLVNLVLAVTIVIATTLDANVSSSQEALDFYTSRVALSLTTDGDALSSLARGTFVRSFHTLANERTLLDIPAETIEEAQRDMLRAFNDLLARRPDRYRRISYVTEDNAVWGEAINTSGETLLNTEYTLRDNTARTTSFILAASGTLPAGEIALSSVIPNPDDGRSTLIFYVLLTETNAGTRGVLELEVDLDATFIPLANIGLRSADYFQPQRRALVASSIGQPLFISDPEDDIDGVDIDEEIIATMAAQPVNATAVLYGDSLLSSSGISLYTGGDMPWHIIIDDSLSVALLPGVGIMVFAVLIIVTVWAGVLLLTQRLIGGGLTALEAAHAGTAQLLDMAPDEDSRGTTDVLPSLALARDQNEVTEMMVAVRGAARKIRSLNRQLDEQVRRRNREIEIAARIGREVALLSDIDAVLNTSIDLIVSEMGFYHAQVFLVDDAGINAMLVYSHGEAGKRLLELKHQLPVGSQTVIGTVTGSAKPVIVNDTQRKDSPHKVNAILNETRAEMGLPLIIGDQVIGALDIQSREPDVFREDDLPMFGLLADQVAVAINKARLVAQSQDRISRIDQLNRQLTRDAWSATNDDNALPPGMRYDLLKVQPLSDPPEDSSPAPGAFDVPISIRGETIGTLSAATGTERSFSRGEQNLLRDISTRIALSIENARLFQETQQTLNETSVLYRLSSTLNEASDPSDILQAVLSVALPDAGGAQLWVFDDYGAPDAPAWMQVYADSARHPRDAANENLIRLRLHTPDHPLLADLQPGQVIVVYDTRADSRLDTGLQLIFRRMAARAVVVVPLYVRSGWLGVLMVEYAQARRFTEREGRLFQALIDQVGVALDNRLLLVQTEQALSRNENLYAASRTINIAQTYADLVNAAVSTSSDAYLDFSLGLLEGSLDDSGWPTQIRLVAYSQGGEIIESDTLVPIDIPPGSPMRQREPEIIRDGIARRQGHATTVNWLDHPEEYAYIALFPLFSVNQPIAVFAQYSQTAHTLSAEDAETYRALTGQMSTQLENRRLLQRTQESLDETRRLYVASRAIAAAPDLKNVYSIAVSSLSQSLIQQAAAQQQDLLVSLLRAEPEPRENAPELVCMQRWQNTSSDGSAPDIYEGERMDNHQAPFAHLLDELVGEHIIADLSQVKLISMEAGIAVQILRQRGAQSAVLVPIRTREQWFGLIICLSSVPNAFDEQYERFVDAIAGQIGLTMENRLLFENAQTEARRAQLEAQRALALAEAAQVANQIGGESSDEQGDLAEVVRQVSQASFYDRWLVAIQDENAQVLEVRTHHLGDQADRVQPPDAFPLDQPSPLADVYHSGSALIVNDIHRETVFQQATVGLDAIKQLGKAILTPITLGGRTIGVLAVGRPPDAEDLDQADLRLVSTLAAQVAVAIENRRLFEQARREQRTLASTLSTLPAGVLVLDPATLTPTIYNDQAREYLGVILEDGRPFNAENYQLFRTGTNLNYPNEELPIFVALDRGTASSTDDIALVLDDTHTLDLLVNAAPILDEDGAISAIVATFSDISNLRSLENTLQENLRETVAIYEAQRQIAEADTLDDVLDAISLQLMMAQPSEGYILMPDLRGRLRISRHLFQSLDSPGLLTPFLDHYEFRYEPDTQRAATLDEPAREALAARGLIALMTAPLRAQGRELPIGWLVLSHMDPNAFSPEQERTLTQLSDIASTGIDNRLLIQQTQAALEETDKLYSATTALSRARDMFQLQDALQAALSSLGADVYAAFLTDELLLTDHIVSHGESVGLLRAALSRHNLSENGLFVEDIDDLYNPSPLLRDLHTASAGTLHSLGVVNLRIKEIVSGRLLIGYHDAHSFSEFERRYLGALSDSTSVVLDNIALVEEIQATLEETTVLYQAVRSLTNATNEHDILGTIIDFIVQTHVDQVFIGLLRTRRWDHPQATLDITASWSKNDSMNLEGVSLSAEEFPAWERFASDSVFALDDVESTSNISDMERIGLQSLDARSVVVIPLRVPNRAIGIVWIGSQEPYKHADAELRVYQSFGEQASLSMEAAYLLAQTERRARQLEISAKVSSAISQILDLETLMTELVNLIRDAFGYDHTQIFLIDESDENAVLRASTGEAGQKLLAIQHALPKGSDSVIGQVTATGRPSIALDTADADVVHMPNPYLPLTRSEMALPLIIKGEVIGALDVQSNQPQAFTPDDVSVLTTLAAQISIALDNANLYRDAQDQAGRMEFLFNITNQAASENTLEDTLNAVAVDLRTTLDLAAVAIYLPKAYLDADENPYTVLTASALNGADIALDQLPSITVGLDDTPLSWVGTEHKLYLENNLLHNPDYQPLTPDARAVLMAPMNIRDQLIGVIVLESRRSNAFQKDGVQLMQTLAGSLSSIVQSVLFLDQLATANDDLRELNRVQSDFLANMSHELRTPLNSIIGFSRVMLKGIDGPLTEMQEQDLTTIFNSGNHLLSLINDILDQAKIASGKLEIKTDYFDISAVIDVVRSMTIGYMKDKNLDLRVEVAPNLPQAYGDEFRLRQVLINLASNAVKFTDKGGITIHVHKQTRQHGQDFIRIDVIDSGIGIAQKDLPLLFEAFRQVDSSLTRTQGGTGLGLPIAKSLIEMMGGEMIVETEVNVGSTFSVTVPTQPQNQAPDDDTDDASSDTQTLPHLRANGKDRPRDTQTQEIDVAHNGHDNAEDSTEPHSPLETRAIPRVDRMTPPAMPTKRQVLLIEENPTMVDQYRRTIQREGFEVLAASIPLEAEAMASGLHPTLIVMDLNFHNGQGWHILERLQNRDDTFDIPVVAVSIHDDRQRALDAGAHSFLQRPYLHEDLAAAVLEAEKESNTDRILIIDDQASDRRLLEQILGGQGRYRVFSADNGADGIALVARRRPDLVILDLRMPEMDGFAVLRELRANPETSRIPIMVVTSAAADLDADEQAQLANVHVLPKTEISKEEFDAFIKNVTDHLAPF